MLRAHKRLRAATQMIPTRQEIKPPIFFRMCSTEDTPTPTKQFDYRDTVLVTRLSANLFLRTIHFPALVRAGTIERRGIMHTFREITLQLLHEETAMLTLYQSHKDQREEKPKEA